ncbi:MAG: uracil phosphoribosyltransferase [Candidatus Caldatribacteriota bacterium]|nr:uracil phosphoribosyltransferase [Atribacterota bacterium]MDD3640666.1 uracil phosphoribosyltransferase [Atribacterota bacterium]MDD4287980.1 uracil phosphoribosyltransferase [Atribacterota bacterium]MDD4765003.1 uracil phosphoribosyltransferase [Atribacterota bacterium]MDD5635294.1 uracil phosphoribosyltransferase [Atribacterota bacterium]
MKDVIVLDHPLIQHKLTMLRDKKTGVKDFRELADELSNLMAYEVTRDIELKEINIETPVARTKGKIISGKKMAIIAILRAGLGMVDGILKLIPSAKVGHVGMYRDPETLKPISYYAKLPKDADKRDIIIVDPMLATGGTAVATIEYVKSHTKSNIKFMCLVAAPEGIKAIHDKFPEIKIYTATIDEGLNSHAYIVPGLGDAGDRLFGTK